MQEFRCLGLQIRVNTISKPLKFKVYSLTKREAGNNAEENEERQSRNSIFNVQSRMRRREKYPTEQEKRVRCACYWPWVYMYHLYCRAETGFPSRPQTVSKKKRNEAEAML